MRLLPLFLSLGTLSSLVLAQDIPETQIPKEKHDYQSDVARLRKIVINSLYSHKEIFLRELISNANDALEKLRLTALTDKSVWDGESPLNITIKAIKDESGKGGRLVISDGGIGMTPEELTKNLGTLAKSGTSEFLAKAENQDGTGNGNLIGAFGLGFYSSFLVADKVFVSSIGPKSAANLHPEQYVFSSSADDSSFEIYPDPRGNTLGRGTEITLVLKEDSLNYLDNEELTGLVTKHSAFSTTFPIFLFNQKTEQVLDEEAIAIAAASEAAAAEAAERLKKEKATEESTDEDEAKVEEETTEEPPKEVTPPPTKSVIVDEWLQLNSVVPLWMRDPKTVSDEDYISFYKATYKDLEAPLAWHHFAGDSGSGASFRAIIYIPSKLDESYWQQPLASSSKDIRLMVKRVFITGDLGEDSLPKWASWVRAVIDAEDLPLNVSRETLQSTKFLRQLKLILVKRVIQLFTRIAEEDEEKFAKIQASLGAIFKLGAVEDTKNREKLAALARFTTTQRNATSLDQYLENKKAGQKQIFYLSEMGKPAADLAKSVFIEKLIARGYEVLLLNEPLDEIFVQNLRNWKKVNFQDVAKAGLKYGDEGEQNIEADKEEAQTLKEEYQPLMDWLKAEAGDTVREVIISNRLVTSPCAIVADQYGMTGNVERMMASSHQKRDDFMRDFTKKQKLLEINPRSPLIKGLLTRVNQLIEDGDNKDLEAEEEVKEVAAILIDGALVRSGFEVPDSNIFFTRVDRVLRRSLGVAENAPTDSTVTPAPPVDPSLEEEAPPVDDGAPRIELPDELKDQMSITMEEIDEDGNVVPPVKAPVKGHDEL